MRRTRFTKPIPLIAGLLSGLLFAILAIPLGAQPAPKAEPYYDIAREVTLKWHCVECVQQTRSRYDRRLPPDAQRLHPEPWMQIWEDGV